MRRILVFLFVFTGVVRQPSFVVPPCWTTKRRASCSRLPAILRTSRSRTSKKLRRSRRGCPTSTSTAARAGPSGRRGSGLGPTRQRGRPPVAPVPRPRPRRGRAETDLGRPGQVGQRRDRAGPGGAMGGHCQRSGHTRPAPATGAGQGYPRVDAGLHPGRCPGYVTAVSHPGRGQQWRAVVSQQPGVGGVRGLAAGPHDAGPAGRAGPQVGLAGSRQPGLIRASHLRHRPPGLAEYAPLIRTAQYTWLARCRCTCDLTPTSQAGVVNTRP